MDADLEDDLYDVLDDEEETNDFPPNLSEFEAADMSIQSQITINKARSDIHQKVVFLCFHIISLIFF